MENPRNKNIVDLIRWHQRRRMAVVQVTCLLVLQRLMKVKNQTENASEMKKRRNSTTEDDEMDTTDGIEHSVHFRNVKHRSKHKKVKKSKVEKEAENTKEALNNVAEALRQGNTVINKTTQGLASQEEEVWKLLMDLHIKEEFVDRAYLYLVERPKNVRALLGCPREQRKNILMMMVFGPSCSPGL